MADYINPRAQACQNCVKAKAKCYGHADGRCERCNRLNKDCEMQVPVARKRKTEQTNPHVQAGRIAQLEHKLDHLVSLVSASQAPLAGGKIPSLAARSPEFTPTPSSTGSPSHYQPLHQGRLIPELSQDQNVSGSFLSPAATSVESATTDHGLRFPGFLLTTRSDESTVITDPDELLNLFRDQLGRQVPFISIPAGITAHEFSKEKPFLYRAIIAVASYHDSVHQIELGEQFVKDLVDQHILQGYKSIDILQGLLVHIAWYNGMLRTKTLLNILLGLAFSLVIDLNLYLPMPNFENHEKFLGEMKGIVTCNAHHWARRVDPTKEEERTILGCFYLFSCVSTNFVRINPLHWTSYIQQCYNNILQNPESENDVYLAHLAELQRISETIRHCGIRSFPSQPSIWNGALGVHFKSLLSDLKRFRSSLPQSLRDDALMMLNYHSVELYLTDICFSMPLTDHNQIPTPQRADVLVMCLAACKSLWSVYFSVHSKQYISFFTPTMTQIYFSMMTLSKLSLFDGEDWDASSLKRTGMNLSTLVDLVAMMLENVSARYDRRDDIKPWLNMSRKMRQVGVRFEGLLATEGRLNSSMPLPQGENLDLCMQYDLPAFDLMDESFWQSLPDVGPYVTS